MSHATVQWLNSALQKSKKSKVSPKTRNLSIIPNFPKIRFSSNNPLASQTKRKLAQKHSSSSENMPGRLLFGNVAFSVWWSLHCSRKKCSRAPSSVKLWSSWWFGLNPAADANTTFPHLNVTSPHLDFRHKKLRHYLHHRRLPSHCDHYLSVNESSGWCHHQDVWSKGFSVSLYIYVIIAFTPHRKRKHRKNCECCPVSQLIVR